MLVTERWRPDYVVDIALGFHHLNNYVIVSGITIAYGGNDFPLILHM